MQEDENKVVASLTNSAVRRPIDLNSAGAGLILSYTQVKDKKKKTTRTFKSEVETDGSDVTIIVRDLITNRVISKNSFPPPTSHDGTGFQTLEQCIQDFRCKHGGELQCEANRSCKTQYAAAAAGKAAEAAAASGDDASSAAAAAVSENGGSSAASAAAASSSDNDDDNNDSSSSAASRSD